MGGPDVPQGGSESAEGAVSLQISGGRSTLSSVERAAAVVAAREAGDAAQAEDVLSAEALVETAAQADQQGEVPIPDSSPVVAAETVPAAAEPSLTPVQELASRAEGLRAAGKSHPEVVNIVVSESNIHPREQILEKVLDAALTKRFYERLEPLGIRRADVNEKLVREAFKMVLWSYYDAVKKGKVTVSGEEGAGEKLTEEEALEAASEFAGEGKRRLSGKMVTRVDVLQRELQRAFPAQRDGLDVLTFQFSQMTGLDFVGAGIVKPSGFARFLRLSDEGIQEKVTEFQKYMNFYSEQVAGKIPGEYSSLGISFLPSERFVKDSLDDQTEKIDFLRGLLPPGMPTDLVDRFFRENGRLLSNIEKGSIVRITKDGRLIIISKKDVDNLVKQAADALESERSWVRVLIGKGFMGIGTVLESLLSLSQKSGSDLFGKKEKSPEEKEKIEQFLQKKRDFARALGFREIYGVVKEVFVLKGTPKHDREIGAIMERLASRSGDPSISIQTSAQIPESLREGLSEIRDKIRSGNHTAETLVESLKTLFSRENMERSS